MKCVEFIWWCTRTCTCLSSASARKCSFVVSNAGDVGSEQTAPDDARFLTQIVDTVLFHILFFSAMAKMRVFFFIFERLPWLQDFLVMMLNVYIFNMVSVQF